MRSLELLEELNKILIDANKRCSIAYENRELEILKDLYNTSQNIETAFNATINKLRKLNQEQETPIYYKRAKKNKGEVIIVKE